MKNRLIRQASSPYLVGILAIVLFLALNVVFQDVGNKARLDLTEDRLYSISDSTRHVLGSLEEPITLTYFFSENTARSYPQIFSYGRRIRDLLRSYESLADGKLILEIVEPEPFSEDEDRAVAAGMQGVPTAQGQSLYMGLVVRDLTTRIDRIPFFAQEREDLLEYDLTKLIASVSEETLPAVSLLTTLPMAPGAYGGYGAPATPGWAVYQQLVQMFDLSMLEDDFTSVPDNISILLIIHPPMLTDQQLYAIDQFIMKGGRVAAFLDPFSEKLAAGPMTQGPRGPEDSTLGPLLASWGVAMIPDMIIGDVELAQRINMGDGSARTVKDYPLWLAIRGDHLARHDPVTSNLEQINLATSGVLVPQDGATSTFEPLVTSSAVSALLDVETARGLPDPDRIMRMIEPADKSYPLIARITGDIASAFPNGPPQATDETGEEDNGTEETDKPVDDTNHLAQSTKPVAIIIGADTDLFDDRFWVQVQNFFGERVLVPVADNANLLINSIDQLSGSDALMGLRGRGVTRRPFDVVEKIRSAADARFRQEEERLQDELALTESRLAELENETSESGQLFSAEQDAEAERFRKQVLEIRQQLRDVQRNLVDDITKLGSRLAFINIALVPVLLILVTLLLTTLRRRRNGKRRQQS